MKHAFFIIFLQFKNYWFLQVIFKELLIFYTTIFFKFAATCPEGSFYHASNMCNANYSRQLIDMYLISAFLVVSEDCARLFFSLIQPTNQNHHQTNQIQFSWQLVVLAWLTTLKKRGSLSPSLLKHHQGFPDCKDSSHQKAARNRSAWRKLACNLNWVLIFPPGQKHSDILIRWD